MLKFKLFSGKRIQDIEESAMKWVEEHKKDIHVADYILSECEKSYTIMIKYRKLIVPYEKFLRGEEI